MSANAAAATIKMNETGTVIWAIDRKGLGVAWDWEPGMDLGRMLNQIDEMDLE